jgi:hypothetical protein
MTYMRTRFGPSAFTHPLARSPLVTHGQMDHEARVLERMLAPAQQIIRWTGQPPPLAARSAVRRMLDGSTRDHCRSGAERLLGVPRRGTYTVVVGPWCEGYWRRIGPYRPSHASLYPACLPPSCSPPFSSSGRPVGNKDVVCKRLVKLRDAVGLPLHAHRTCTPVSLLGSAD